MFYKNTLTINTNGQVNIGKFFNGSKCLYMKVDEFTWTFTNIPTEGAFLLETIASGRAVLPKAVLKNVDVLKNGNTFKITSITENSVVVAVPSKKALTSTTMFSDADVEIPEIVDEISTNVNVDDIERLLAKRFETPKMTLTKRENNIALKIEESDGSALPTLHTVKAMTGSAMIGTNTFIAKSLPSAFTKTLVGNRVNVYTAGKTIYIEPANVIDIFGKSIKQVDAKLAYMSKMNAIQTEEFRQAIKLAQEVKTLRATLSTIQSAKELLD